MSSRVLYWALEKMMGLHYRPLGVCLAGDRRSKRESSRVIDCPTADHSDVSKHLTQIRLYLRHTVFKSNVAKIRIWNFPKVNVVDNSMRRRSNARNSTLSNNYFLLLIPWRYRSVHYISANLCLSICLAFLMSYFLRRNYIVSKF